MWKELLLTGVMGIGIGSVAIPVTRNWWLGDVENDWMAGELNFDCIEPDRQTIRNKDGLLTRVFKIRGTSYDSKVHSQQKEMMKGREACLLALGHLGIIIHFFGIKREQDISFDANWPSPVLEKIGNAERDFYKSSYDTKWFVLISSLDYKDLIEATDKIYATMGIYEPSLLKSPNNPQFSCPLTCFMNYLVSGDLRDDLRPISQNISGNILGSDFTPDKKIGFITTFVPNPKKHKIIAITKWPEQVSGKLIAELMAIPGDIEVSQICEPMGLDESLLLYKRREIEARLPVIGSDNAQKQCLAIMELLKQGNTCIFHTQMQVIVRGDTEAQVEVLVTLVTKLLGNLRITHSVQTKGAPVCWLNRFPKKLKKVKTPGFSELLFPLDLQEQNIAALWALNHAPRGMSKGPHGPYPVRIFATPSGQSYAFQFQVKEKRQSLGNYLIFAPSDSGKSTLIMHLLAGLAKFEDVRSFIFDSKEGARFMVEGFGGIYQGYDDLQLNFLDVGEETPQNRHRIYTVLKAMAGNTELDHDDEEALNHAINCAFTLETPDRTLNQIYEFAFAKRSNLRRAFARFVTDSKGNAGMNSHIFNAPHDSLGSFLNSSFMVGINMNEALEDPVVGPSVVTHIASAIYKSAAKSCKGFNMFIDEAAKLTMNKGFCEFAAEAYREVRKLDGCVGMAFQDPKAIYDSGYADAFFTNTATQIWMPNSQLTKESLDRQNFNEEQKNFVLGGEFRERKSGAREVMIIKKDHATGSEETAIVDVNLAPLGPECLKHYRAGEEANALLSSLKIQWGDQWHQHL